MKEVFTKKILKYNLRNCRQTLLPNPKTKKYGTDAVAYKAFQIWSTLPKRHKNLPSLDLFKSEIKSWHCSDFPCNICRILPIRRIQRIWRIRRIRRIQWIRRIA